MSRTHSTVKSFGYAWDGVKTALTQEPNFKVHAIAAILAIGAGFILGLSRIEWIILALVIAAVLVLELINTALEALVDLVSPGIRPAAKIAKDVCAAAVLTAAVAAALVGILLFGPKLLAIVQERR